jgi:hypothetical protein
MKVFIRNLIRLFCPNYFFFNKVILQIFYEMKTDLKKEGISYNNQFCEMFMTFTM